MRVWCVQFAIASKACVTCLSVWVGVVRFIQEWEFVRNWVGFEGEAPSVWSRVSSDLHLVVPGSGMISGCVLSSAVRWRCLRIMLVRCGVVQMSGP